MKHALRYLPLGDQIHDSKWGQVGVIAALILLSLILPLITGFDARIINVVLFVSIYAILALGLNVVVGYTGLLDLGYVTFLATGAILTFDLLLLTAPNPFTESQAKRQLPITGKNTQVVQKHELSEEGMAVSVEYTARGELEKVSKKLQRRLRSRGWTEIEVQEEGGAHLLTASTVADELTGRVEEDGDRVRIQLAAQRSGLILPVGTTKKVKGERPLVFEGSYLFMILIAGIVGALIGVVRGIPTLKLTGDYYAIVTLGIAEIIFLIYLNTPSFTGGAFGMKLSLDSRPVLLGEKLYYDTAVFYYFVIFALVLTVILMDRLNRSRIGRAWAAIRLDELAARASGINVSREKMVAFAISGFVGSAGGAIYAIWIGTVVTKALDIWQSILILCAVVLGGMGSIRGVLLGSVILFSLRELLREELGGVRVPPQASFLIYGLLLVFVMRFRPQGLLPRGQGESVAMSPEEEAELRETKPRLFVLKEASDE